MVRDLRRRGGESVTQRRARSSRRRRQVIGRARSRGDASRRFSRFDNAAWKLSDGAWRARLMKKEDGHSLKRSHPSGARQRSRARAAFCSDNVSTTCTRDVGRSPRADPPTPWPRPASRSRRAGQNLCGRARATLGTRGVTVAARCVPSARVSSPPASLASRRLDSLTTSALCPRDAERVNRGRTARYNAQPGATLPVVRAGDPAQGGRGSWSPCDGSRPSSPHPTNDPIIPNVQRPGGAAEKPPSDAYCAPTRRL